MATATNTSLTVVPNTVYFGQENKAIFYVNVRTSPVSNIIPSGSVAVYADAIILCIIQLDNNGDGSCRICPEILPPCNKTYPLQAIYRPKDSNLFQASQSPTGPALTVIRDSIAITPLVNPNPAYLNKKTLLEAIISSQITACPISKGFVTFFVDPQYDGNGLLNKAVYMSPQLPVGPDGKVSLPYVFTTLGPHTVRAKYIAPSNTLINQGDSIIINVIVVKQDDEIYKSSIESLKQRK